MDRPPSLLRILLLVAALGVVYAVLARAALHGFPFSGDEYSYYLQAELFARGVLHAPTPSHPELLRVDHVILSPWVCSKYPPGTSALLALGVRLGVPWLVTPVEGVVALLAMAAAARRTLSDGESLVAVALVGASPLFAFQSATFFSHTAATMWLAIAFAAVAGWTNERGAWRLLLAGAAIGCAFVTRPLDALLFAAALLVVRPVRSLLPVALGAVPLVALLLVYQAAQFGSPFRDGYAAYLPTFEAIYGARAATSALSPGNAVDPVQMAHHLDILRALVVDWTVPGTALLALFGWVALRGRDRAFAMRRIAAALLALLFISLWFTIGGTDDGARPRYLSIALIPLAFLGAPGWFEASRLLQPRVGALACRAVAVTAWIIPVVQLGAFLLERGDPLAAREGLERSVAAAGIDRAVVVVRAEYPTRYARNGPFFDRSVLYVSAPATMDAAEVAVAFPGRDVYEARQGWGEVWHLEKRSPEN